LNEITRADLKYAFISPTSVRGGRSLYLSPWSGYWRTRSFTIGNGEFFKPIWTLPFKTGLGAPL